METKLQAARRKVASMSDVQLRVAYELTQSELENIIRGEFKSESEYLKSLANARAVLDMLEDEIASRTGM